MVLQPAEFNRDHSGVAMLPPASFYLVVIR